MKPSRFYETPRRRENHIRRLELFALAGESPRAPTRAEMTGPRNRRRANPRVSRRDVSIASGMNDRRALYRYSLRRDHCRARQVTIEAAFPLYGGRDLSLQSRSSKTVPALPSVDFESDCWELNDRSLIRFPKLLPRS